MKNIRKIENLHVGLWLLKDAAWCSSWKMLGMAMAPPTLAIAVYIAWSSRHEIEELVHSVAVSLWICANMIWMTGEFFKNDGTRPQARVFFAAGLVLLAVFYAGELVKWFRGRAAVVQRDRAPVS